MPQDSEAPRQRSKSCAEKLRDPRWLAKREEVFDRDGYRCVLCRGERIGLECHHLYYLPDTEPWDYPLRAYATLDRSCHKEVERLIRLWREATPLARLTEAVGFSLGLRALERPGEPMLVAGAGMALGVAAAYGLDPGAVVRRLAPDGTVTGGELAVLALTHPAPPPVGRDEPETGA